MPSNFAISKTLFMKNMKKQARSTVVQQARRIRVIFTENYGKLSILLDNLKHYGYAFFKLL